MFYTSVPASPSEYSTRQLGGIECVTDNGRVRVLGGTVNPLYVGVEARVVPDGSALWEEYRTSAGKLIGDRAITCIQADNGVLDCSIDQLLGDTWLSLYLTGVPPEAGPNDTSSASIAVFDAFAGRIEASGVIAASWTPPASTRPIGTCERVLPPETVREVLGTSGPDFVGVNEDYAGVDSSARSAAGGLLCYWYTDSAYHYGGQATALQGGEWGFREAVGKGVFRDADPQSLSGVPATSAFVACADALCRIDFVIAHNWVNISFVPSEAVVSVDDAKRILVSLAERVVIHVQN